jgi:riboflavin biosynthesis pyrimidine reductase
VLLKAALTLDGRIATASGESKWITSRTQRLQARWLRRLHDGVVVGIGTVLADDPLLLPQPRTRRPFARVVLDTRLRLPLASRLVRSASARTPVLVLTAARSGARRRALEDRGVRVITLAAERPHGSAARARGASTRGARERDGRGRRRVLGSFAARLVDEVALFRAPLLLEDRRSLSAFGGPDPKALGRALLPRARAGAAGLPMALAAALRALAAEALRCSRPGGGAHGRLDGPLRPRARGDRLPAADRVVPAGAREPAAAACPRGDRDPAPGAAEHAAGAHDERGARAGSRSPRGSAGSAAAGARTDTRTHARTGASAEPSAAGRSGAAPFAARATGAGAARCASGSAIRRGCACWRPACRRAALRPQRPAPPRRRTKAAA